MHEESLSGRDGRTDLSAPGFDFGFDGVADLARAGEFFLVRARDGGGIREAPVKAGGDAGIDGAAFGAGFVANGDDVRKGLAGLIDVENGL